MGPINESVQATHRGLFSDARLLSTKTLRRPILSREDLEDSYNSYLTLQSLFWGAAWRLMRCAGYGRLVDRIQAHALGEQLVRELGAAISLYS